MIDPAYHTLLWAGATLDLLIALVKSATPDRTTDLNQLLSALLGPFFRRAKLHIAHPKAETSAERWGMIHLQNHCNTLIVK